MSDDASSEVTGLARAPLVSSQCICGHLLCPQWEDRTKYLLWFCSDGEQLSISWDYFPVASFLLISSFLFSCSWLPLTPQTEVQDLIKRIQCCFPKAILKEEGTNSYFLCACCILGLNLYASELLWSPWSQRGTWAWGGGTERWWLLQRRWRVRKWVWGLEISKTRAFFPFLPPSPPSCFLISMTLQYLLTTLGFWMDLHLSWIRELYFPLRISFIFSKRCQSLVFDFFFFS